MADPGPLDQRRRTAADDTFRRRRRRGNAPLATAHEAQPKTRCAGWYTCAAVYERALPASARILGGLNNLRVAVHPEHQ